MSASAVAYCDELARRIIARAIELNKAGDEKAIKAFSDSFYKAFRSPPAPIDLASADYAVISCSLRGDPRAQARLAAIVQYTPSKWLLEQEMMARGFWPPKPGEPTDVYELAYTKQLNGICFSGGGIRSATFNLGVLQGLAFLKKLNCFDYLSTVSGGGYVHQFLASWIECESLEKVQCQLNPLPGSEVSPGGPPRTVWPDPIRWLRRYSNYLTPSKGLLTTDTWSAISIWLRNTMLNQIVLISSLLFILLLPHFHLAVGTKLGPWLLSWTGQIVCGVLMLLLFGYASKTVRRQMELVRAAGTNPGGHTGFGGGKAITHVFLPILLAAFIASPYIYHSAFWNGTPRVYKNNKPPKFEEKIAPALALHSRLSALGPDSSRILAQHLHSLVPSKSATGMDNLRVWQTAYSFPWWVPSFEPGSTSIVFLALLIGIAFVVPVLYAAIPPRIDKWELLVLTFFGVLGVAYLLLHLARLVFFYLVFFVPADQVTRLGIAILPTLALTVMFVSFDLSIGLIGNAMADPDREWLARFRALSFLGGFGWLGLVGCSLLGPRLVDLLLLTVYLKHAMWMGWLGTTVASVLAGKSPKTSGTGADKTAGTFSPLNILIKVGPPVFMVGLTLILSWVLERTILSFESQASTETHPFITFGVLLTAILMVVGLFGWRVDINDFSMHSFYRDRLARCYAGASNPDRRPNPFTGFAASDHRVRMVDLLPALFGNPRSRDLWGPDGTCKSAPEGTQVSFQSGSQPTGLPSDAPVKTKWYQGPFPIFCTTINLSFGEDLAYQERKAAAFAFTPLYCGYDVGWTEATSKHVQFNGFTRTRDYAYPEVCGPTMATAVAASGAALSPNWGFHTSPAMAFLLTIFNARLGWWIRNPRYKSSVHHLTPTPHFGLWYLLRELFGMVNDNAPYVYLSDGGHFENMGLYELVRRRCTNIVICDAEQDGDLNFQGIGMAIRKCRIDFGAEIDLDLSKLDPSGTSRSSATNFIEGTITYPGGFRGNILYIKSLYTPGLPPDLVNYRREHSAFPDDTTLNQWFTESQFESYRRLGHFTIAPTSVTTSAMQEVSDAVSDVDGPSTPSVQRWLERLTPRV